MEDDDEISMQGWESCGLGSPHHVGLGVDLLADGLLHVQGLVHFGEVLDFGVAGQAEPGLLHNHRILLIFRPVPLAHLLHEAVEPALQTTHILIEILLVDFLGQQDLALADGDF